MTVTTDPETPAPRTAGADADTPADAAPAKAAPARQQRKGPPAAQGSQPRPAGQGRPGNGPGRAAGEAAAADGGQPVRTGPARAAQGGPRHGPRRPAATADAPRPARPAQVTPPAPEQAFAAGPIDALTAQEVRLFGRLTALSFVALVVVPVIAAAIYLFAFAADRYAVEVKFAVRSPAGLPASDLVGMVTGGAATSTQSDSYMVVEYLQSRQFLDELTGQLDLVGIYSVADADFLYRLPDDASKEDQVDYLSGMVSPRFDATAQIVTVEVQAFAPEAALLVAERVMQTAGNMVNRLSEQARRDTVRLAEAEVARAEAALKAQRSAIAAFRETEQQIDPAQRVATQEGVLATLQGTLASARAELRNLQTFLAPDAPSIRVLQSRIASIESQIDAERSRLGGGGTVPAAGTGTLPPDTLTGSVSLYEALSVDLEFHQRTYLSALASLETARVEADRQQRYLASVVLPALPESAVYPRVALTLVLVAAVAFMLWSITAMFVHIIREHLR